MTGLTWDRYLLSIIIIAIVIFLPTSTLMHFLRSDERNWAVVKARVIGRKSYNNRFLDNFHRTSYRGSPLTNYSRRGSYGSRHYLQIEYIVNGKVYHKERYFNPEGKHPGTGGTITIEYYRKNPWYTREPETSKTMRLHRRKMDKKLFIFSEFCWFGIDFMLLAFLYHVLTTKIG